MDGPGPRGACFVTSKPNLPPSILKELRLIIHIPGSFAYEIDFIIQLFLGI